MTIAPLHPDQQDLWIALRRRLWPEASLLTHQREARELLAAPERAAVFLAWPEPAASTPAAPAAPPWGALWGPEAAETWMREWTKAMQGGFPSFPPFWPGLGGARPAPVGFAEARLRADPVNGAEETPAAFLEGIFVAPESRRRGIGRALIAAAEAWAKAIGRNELISDALLDDDAGRALRQAAGFEERERVVFYRKRLR